MADLPAKPVSPMSHVLQTLGLTREDLLKHSDQMRQFLTAEDANSLRVLVQDIDPQQPSLRSSASLARSISRSSSHASPPPVPHTPIKSEPPESVMPPRYFDSMEAVIERKSRQSKRDRKSRKARDKDKEKHDADVPSFSLDTFMQTRKRDTRVEEQHGSNTQVPALPVTPQTRKYYREHTHEGSSSRPRTETFTPRPASPTPTRNRTKSLSAHPTPILDPVTPRNRNDHYKSPLPASSPPPQSSPFSSPTRRIVNLVSSPGPMGPLPAEDEYDDLPYTLPPGPYPSTKPDLSYAALVGQAVLSSPEHRLTLQEIYDWITIVYPHFKRGETTWMNSIRHVLSTTACFRKVTRERTIGRTLWAIWDCDLECFRDGGFKKQFCADMMSGKSRVGRKRGAPPTDDTGSAPKKAKRQKKAPATTAMHYQPAIFPAPPMTHSLPLFPHTRPSIHHQPYYESCFPQPVMPAELMFPPLPPSSGYHRLTSVTASTSASTSQSSPPLEALQSLDEEEPPTSPSLPSSSASIPSLTPNCSSSSPLLNSEDTPSDASASQAPAVATPDMEDPEKYVFLDNSVADALEPSITLHSADQQLKKLNKGKVKQVNEVKVVPKKALGLPPMPVSPTLERKSASRLTKATKAASPPASPPARTLMHPTTPPPRPSTPPRNPNNSTVNISPVRTPLSHKGLHMSPSPSLAHYKSHLDPPPAAHFLDPESGSINPALTVDAENMRTPSRKRTTSSIFGPPVTPKKLIFPGMQDSPFRTPGSRASIFDPHDPGALLDEELSRMGASQGAQDSPMGLFGGSRGMLYESPNTGSPGRWTKWW